MYVCVRVVSRTHDSWVGRCQTGGFPRSFKEERNPFEHSSNDEDDGDDDDDDEGPDDEEAMMTMLTIMRVKRRVIMKVRMLKLLLVMTMMKR